MRTCCASVLASGLLYVSALGQTVFMSPQPGPTVDLSDALNPSVLAGHPIVIEILLDATETTAPQVGALDMQLSLIDLGRANRGKLECGKFVVDTTRKDLILESCNFCPARCYLPAFAAAGLLDNAAPWHDVDFLAYIATITLFPTPDAAGDWLLGYATEMDHVIIGGVTGAIVDIVNNPDSFIPLAITVRPAPFIVHGKGGPGETKPVSGSIDPRYRRDEPIGNLRGRATFTILFSEPVFAAGGGPLSPSDFVITDTAGGTHVVQSVDAANNPEVVITLSHPLPMSEWTTIRAVVVNAAGEPIPNQGDLGQENEPDRVDLAFLPGDIDRSGAVGPRDLSRCRQLVNRTITPDAGVVQDYVDTNRDGRVSPADLTAFRELAFGTVNATQPWARVSLNHPRP
ncbi:MAG: dockerin type I domain-containing protein [Phycisphaerae bacterium]